MKSINKYVASFALLLCLIFSSCVDSLVEDPVEGGKNIHRTAIKSRSLDDALACADELFAQIDGSATKSSTRVVKTVDFLMDSKTRSGKRDTLMYVINYEDNRGFALVGKSFASRGVYAISNKGSICLDDTINNVGLSMFINTYINDALLSSIIPVDKPIYVYLLKRKVEPRLPNSVAAWVQSHPYNVYTPVINGHQSVVGCVPLAVGMLCRYYQYPEYLNNQLVNWPAIIEENTDEISKLLAILGSREYLNTSVDRPDERGTDTGGIAKFFSKCNFDTIGSLNNVSFYSNRKVAFDFIASGSVNKRAAPVLISGQNVNSQGEIKSHMWVVDGFMEMSKKAKININIPEIPWTESDPYLHCVWGWGENANGYFLYSLDNQALEQDKSIGIPKYSNLRMWGLYEVTHVK